MTGPFLPDLVLYGRPGCDLCDETRSMLEALLAERAGRALPCPDLIERDITSDPALERTFRTTIPVVELGERRLQLATSPAMLRRFLTEALDGRPTPAAMRST